MLKKFCEVSSCNGVVDLYEARNNKCRFAFWSIILTCMMGASVYFTYATIHAYMTTPTVTNVETVWENSLDMPEVLICYNGGLNITAMLSANLSRELTKVLASKLFIQPSQESHEELMTFMGTNKLKMKDVYEMFSYRCEQMIAMFGIPGGWEILKNDSRCNIAIPLWTKGGVCYLYKNNSAQIYPGEDSGIEIDLNGYPIERQEVFTQRELAKVKITNDYSISLEKSFGRQISIKTALTIPLNSNVIITLNSKRNVRLYESGKCDNRDETYNSNTCSQNCYTDEMAYTCTCITLSYVSFERYPDLDICDLLTEWNCPLNRTNAKHCQMLCRPRCDEWIFENMITMSTRFNEVINENSTTHVSIHYDTLQYIKIEEVNAYTIEMAVVNVGGQSGLWLGASFVTIIQAAYYFALALIEKLVKKKCKEIRDV